MHPTNPLPNYSVDTGDCTMSLVFSSKQLVKMRPRLQNWFKRIGLFAGFLIATHYMVILKTYLPGKKPFLEVDLKKKEPRQQIDQR